jgi:hypothetical protein
MSSDKSRGRAKIGEMRRAMKKSGEDVFGTSAIDEELRSTKG